MVTVHEYVGDRVTDPLQDGGGENGVEESPVWGLPVNHLRHGLLRKDSLPPSPRSPQTGGLPRPQWSRGRTWKDRAHGSSLGDKGVGELRELQEPTHGLGPLGTWPPLGVLLGEGPLIPEGGEL